MWIYNYVQYKVAARLGDATFYFDVDVNNLRGKCKDDFPKKKIITVNSDKFDNQNTVKKAAETYIK